jgi:hypothetical protein
MASFKFLNILLSTEYSELNPAKNSSPKGIMVFLGI